MSQDFLTWSLISAAPKVAVSREESFAEKLAEMEELKGIPGPLYKSSESVELTESETEYVIKCIKHSFANHLVLQVKLSKGKKLKKFRSNLIIFTCCSLTY